MPTAVERLTKYLTRMLSLETVEGEATQALFATLVTQIDDAVAALETAATPTAFKAAEQQYGHIFLTFSQDGYGFQREFDRIGLVLGGVDLALGGKSGHKTPAQTDFVALDHQLFATGADLGAFGAAMKTMGTMRSQSQLPGAVTSTAKATLALQSDFGALSQEAAALAADLPAGDPAHAALVAAITPTISEFASLSTDFGNFTTLLGGTPNPIPEASASPLTFNGVFASLDTHFIALDNSLHGLAGPLANMLVASFKDHGYPHG